MLKNANINYMKYITLILLLSVLLYGMQHQIPIEATVTATSNQTDELPIYSVDTDKPLIALTFDSAWGDEDLDDILKILKKHNAPATFFVTGQWAEKYPDAIKKIDKEGHELANHGNSHKHMPQEARESMITEIQGCHDTVKSIIGKEMTLFRAPYSDWNKEVIDVARSMGYYSINHSVDSLDWKDYGVESIIRTVTEHENLENGSIILLHNGATYTKDALDIMLTKLEEQGFSFAKVSDIIYTSDYHFDHTGKQIPNKKQ